MSKYLIVGGWSILVVVHLIGFIMLIRADKPWFLAACFVVWSVWAVYETNPWKTKD